ncbi:MAG: hypothetical protein M9885_00865 [Burkholderiaceae bacterium]|nr:hypothetical protein [Burkholderiaceae bacterium]
MTAATTPAVLRSEPGVRGSWYGDRSCAQRAIAMALPAIEAAVARSDVSGTGFLSIVVVDPALAPGDCRFEEAIVAEHHIGDRAQWDADYDAFARAKARQAWQHAGDTHRLQALQPHRLRAGDVAVWGAVCLDGIVVGVSGAHPWYDEAFATMVAACLRALAKDAAARQQAPFVGPASAVAGDARGAGSAAAR